MDAVHIRKAHLFGDEDGAELCALFAASYPERVESLSVYALTPRLFRADNYPFGRDEAGSTSPSPAERMAMWDRGWGMEAAREDYEYAAPSVANDEEEVERWARYLQLSASHGGRDDANVAGHGHPGGAPDREGADPRAHADPPAIRPEPLVARWVADQIDVLASPRFPDGTRVAGRRHEHAHRRGRRVRDRRQRGASTKRVLATILFTDVVGSTERAVELGDARWKELLASHQTMVRAELATYRGREVDTAGDGFFAIFDGPARAVRCARAAIDAVRSLGLQIRAGVHTGEVEASRGDVRGVAVHIGARVAAIARPTRSWSPRRCGIWSPAADSGSKMTGSTI